MMDRGSLHTLVEDLRADAAQYRTLGRWYKNPGFWIGATYRARRWTERLPSKLLRAPITLPLWAANSVWRTWFNVHLPRESEIGPELCLVHPRNILVDPAARIGRNCQIFHEVTIGTNANNSGLPTIGDKCCVYAGARVLGGIAVGDQASIGPNCVVITNVPAGSAIAPAANRVISAALMKTLKSTRPSADPAPKGSEKDPSPSTPAAT
jgi:serine O-acetyltransferase